MINANIDISKLFSQSKCTPEYFSRAHYVLDYSKLEYALLESTLLEYA